MSNEIEIPSIIRIPGDKETWELGCLHNIAEQLQTMNEILTRLCDIMVSGGSE